MWVDDTEEMRKSYEEIPWLAALKNRDPRLLSELHQYANQAFISPTQHFFRRRLDLANRVLPKTRIYLDQRYWVFCRDAFEGKAQKPEHDKITRKLLALADSTRVVCPVSYSTLEETLKIGDLKRRHSTARLIDLLCQGVAVRSPSERIRLEFFYLWESQEARSEHIIPCRLRVWTYPAWMIGEYIPTTLNLEPQIQAIALKFIYDRLAEMPFSEMLEVFENGGPSTYPRLKKMAESFNANAERRQKKSPNQIFEEEIADFIDNGILFDNGVIRNPDPAMQNMPSEYSELSIRNEEVRRFIDRVKASCGRGQWTTEFPSLHLFAGVHAMSRIRNEAYEVNDLFDCDHACAALPYCDALFTEKHISTLLTQKPFCYDQTYECRVIAREGEVLEYLDAL